jgi:hypothetical protein
MTGTATKRLHHGTPLPLGRGRHGRRPLEERASWDPWLPLAEAYPVTTKPLRVLALFLLVLFTLLALVPLLAELHR